MLFRSVSQSRYHTVSQSRYRSQNAQIEADTQLKRDQSSAAVTQAANTNALTSLYRAQAKGVDYDNESKALEAGFASSAAGPVMKVLEKIGSGAGAVGSVAGVAGKVWKNSPALKMKVGK